MIGSAGHSNPANLRLAARFALRELRGGLRGFYIFIACIALGVAAISGVTSLSRSLTEGISAEGQSILGGDLSVSIVHRQASQEEATYLENLGDVSRIATLRAMARLPNGVDQSLVELKAVDAAYPLYGTLSLSDDQPAKEALSRQNGIWGAIVDSSLLARLNVSVGDQVNVGKATFTITGAIENEPDKLASGLEFGPRFMVSDAALEETGLIQPGSLVRWHYRIRLPEGTSSADFEKIAAEAEKTEAGSGWRVRSRANASPGLQRNISRFAQFLTLVGLTALVVGGVGVANAIRAYLDTKREVIASFKCLGANGGFVFQIYLIQMMLLAGIGIGIGLVIGAIIPFAAGAVLSGVLPVELAVGIYPTELLLGLCYGFLTALTFALWPLGLAHDIPPTALFRDQVSTQNKCPASDT